MCSARKWSRRFVYAKVGEVHIILTWFVETSDVLPGYAGSKAFE